jgi:peptidoglycan/LPS O-acetylase OafA/YrhL
VIVKVMSAGVVTAAATPTERDVGHLPVLDAMRAVAALLVFAHHLAFHFGITFGPLQPFAAGGRAGVTIFFVLSGFLLFEPFVRGPVETRGYLLRRVLRIVPAYVVALVGVSLLSGNGSFAQQPLTYVLFLQNFDQGLFQQFLAPAWTLSLEMTFYLALPLIAVGLARFGPQAVRAPTLVLWGLACVSMAGGWLVLGNLARPNEWAADLFPFMFWAFVPGMLLAIVAVRRPDLIARVRPRRTLPLAIALVAGGLALNVVHGDLLTATGTALVIAVALRTSRTLRITRPLALLATAGATLSYPFYLWHLDVIHTLQRLQLSGTALAVAALVATGAIAAVSYVLVERPAMRLGRRLTVRRDPRPDPRPDSRSAAPIAPATRIPPPSETEALAF